MLLEIRPVEPIAVVIGQQIEPGAGAHLGQRHRAGPAPRDLGQAQAEGHAAADLVGLGGPVAHQPGQLVAVGVAERGEGGPQAGVGRPLAAVDRVVSGQGGARLARQQQAQQFLVVGDGLAERLVHGRAAPALGLREQPEQVPSAQELHAQDDSAVACAGAADHLTGLAMPALSPVCTACPPSPRPAFYPVFPPSTHAREVLAWLHEAA